MSKDKQIEEMREKIHAEISKAVESGLVTWTEFADWLTEALYNAGYRKQSEGEWKRYKTPLDSRQTGWICSKCSSVIYDLSNGDTDFCPNCGAKMKGGAE